MKLWRKISIKALLIYMSAFMLIMPFFSAKLYAIEYNVDFNNYDLKMYEIPAYQYFFNSNFQIIDSTYTYQQSQNNPQYLNVYNYQGNLVGYFGGYQEGSTSTAIMVCAIGNNGARSCQSDYYVRVNDTNANYTYDYTVFNKPILKGVYQHSFNNQNYINMNLNDKYIFSFILHNSGYFALPQIQLDLKNLWGLQGDIVVKQLYNSLYASDIHTFEFTLKNNNVEADRRPFDFIFTNYVGQNIHVTPLYLGNAEGMPKELYSYIYNDEPIYYVVNVNTDNLLENGNQNTQNIINQSNDVSNELNNVIGNYDLVEQQFTNDFNNNLNAIDLSLNLNNIQPYLNASIWVSNQFNQLVSYQPVRIMIELSLILGIALLLLGKRFNR